MVSDLLVQVGVAGDGDHQVGGGGLGLLAAHEHTPLIVDILNDEGSVVEIRHAAAKALDDLGNDAALAALQPAPLRTKRLDLSSTMTVEGASVVMGVGLVTGLGVGVGVVTGVGPSETV